MIVTTEQAHLIEKSSISSIKPINFLNMLERELTMLTHEWRDTQINQMTQDGEIGKYTLPKGYVNATQMCKANKKFLADYTKLKSTKQYLQSLSHDMKILISSLVIEIQGHGSEQSTWVHPEVAIDLARWVSVEFRIWANRTLMKVMIGQESVQNQSMTQVQLLVAIAQQMAEQEQRLLAQEQGQTELLYRLKAVEVEQDRFNTPCGHKFSVVGFANLQGLEISTKEASEKGRKASALCRNLGIDIERIHDPRFGKVGLYPESVLIEVFSTNQN